MDRGLIEFIHMKIMAGNTEESIRAALLTAGIDNQSISDGFAFVRQKYPDIHQDIAASHNFLPPLNKKITGFDIRETESDDVDIEEGFFAGRLRRRDFTLGLILVPGFAITFIAIILSFLQIVSPEGYERALHLFSDSSYKDVLLLIVLLLPFIIKMFDLAIRRLHDFAVAGWPSFILLLPVALLFNIPDVLFSAITGVVVLFLFFILLKRGTQGANQYGEHYPYQGGFLKRIFHK